MLAFLRMVTTYHLKRKSSKENENKSYKPLENDILYFL